MYRGIFIYRAKQIWQYKLALFSSLPLYFLRGLLSISILMAFNSLSFDLEQRGELINYIWIQTCLAPFISSWMIDNDLATLIKSGDIACDYMKPINLYWSWFTRLISQRFFTGVISSLPLLLIVVFLPIEYRLVLTISMERGFIILLVILLALILNTVLSLLVYISVFHTLSIIGSLLVFGSVVEFCGGLVLPFTLFPESMKQVLSLLPFKYGIAYPIQLVSGHTGEPSGIFFQVAWIMLLIACGQRWLNANLKQIIVQGG